MSRIKVTEKEVFTFSELSEDQKDKAMLNLWEINLCHDWSESTIEDAANVGLKITGFDIDRGECMGDFIKDALFTANQIISEHGDICETYKTAQSFLKERGEAVNNDDANANEFNQQLEDIENDFLSSILEDYRIILQKEYEYQGSREAIIETIEANEYEFDANGRIA